MPVLKQRLAKQIPPYSALQIVAETERDSPEAADGPTSAHPFRKRTAGALLRFLGLVNELIELSKTESLSSLVDTLIDRTDYKPYIMADEDGEDRWENVAQLVSSAAEFEEKHPDAVATPPPAASVGWVPAGE